MSGLSDNEREVLEGFASRVDKNDPGAMNNLGVLYFRKGMYDEAINQFKEALKTDSKFNLAKENLQHLFSETDMEDPDVERWKKEIEKDPDNDQALLRLGISYQNMGKFSEAARILGDFVKHNPDYHMARIHLGSSLKSQGLYQQALEHYLAAGENVQKSTVFHTDLGEIYYNLGRTDEAIMEFRAAIKLDPEYWRSHFLLSFADGDIGNFQEALEESRIASKLNPSFQNSEANLALNDTRGAGADTARKQENDIPSLESTSFTLGKAYMERGYYSEAQKEFKKSIEEMKDKDRVYVEIGKLHMIKKEYSEALPVFLKALQINDDNAEAYRFCGSIYHIREELDKAAACYLQSFRLNLADVNTINNLGVILYQVGLIEEAERMFKKGLNLKIYNLELNYNFLTCNLLKEEYMMVENLIQRLEAFVGKSAALYEKRAILHFRMDRMTAALFDIQSALSVNQCHSDAIYLKGLIQLREEDFAGAIKSILEAASIKEEYTGFYLTLSNAGLGEGEPIKIDSSLIKDVDENLVELLSSGIERRFDKIRESLESLVSRGVSELEEEKNNKKEAEGKATQGDRDNNKTESSEIQQDKEKEEEDFFSAFKMKQ
ncbi:MAG TPA: tetratricopeptide repeat protein [Candidatus Krumholzibacteriaceae bacterium]|nr:tetratricopeptide repeat protein [Candidatus Krumholzibacteriaceae bacterium]